MPKDEYILAITLHHVPSAETVAEHREHFGSQELMRLVLERRELSESQYGPIVFPLILKALGREPKDGNQ